MKRNLTGMALTLALAAGLTACNGDGPAAPPVPEPPTTAHGSLAGTLQAGQVRQLSADTTYLLQGTFVVDSGAVLRIPAGTTILGDAAVRPTALLVRVGGQIFAEGTAEKPIVFTSSKPVGERARGDWGGVILAGRSLCNFPAPCQAEGIPTRYGGNRLDDDSGTLRYVRIEFAGFEVSPGNELNALTLYGVGSGTQIDHIQVHMGSDDGLELFGGTVNVKYAVATGNEDDSFDYSTGWQGKGQFWIVQQSENAGDKGFEVDGNESNFTATPLTRPTLYNVTVIGRGTGSKDGLQLRRGYAGEIFNAIVMGFAGGAGVDVDDQATFTHCTATHKLVSNAIFSGNKELLKSDSDPFDAPACLGAGIREVDPQLAAPTDRTNPDFRPRAGSPALTGAATPPADGFFEAVDYIGAVAPAGTPWYAGWITTATR